MTTVFLDEVRGRNEVLRPRARFVGPRPAMDAETNEDVAGLHRAIELLEENASKTDVVGQCADEGGVVTKGATLEASFPFDPGELGDVARQMAGIGRAAAVAACKDGAIAAPGIEEDVDDGGKVGAACGKGDFCGFTQVGVDEFEGGGMHRGAL